MNKIVKSELNDYVAKLTRVKVDFAKAIFTIGAILYDIKDKELWKEAYDSFEEFIAIPELSFSRRTAFKAMKIWFVFIEKFAIPADQIIDIDSDKLYKIANHVDDDNIEEMLEMARNNSRSDVNAHINELKGLPPKPTTLEKIDSFIKLYPIYQPAREALIAWESYKKDKVKEKLNEGLK